LIHKTNCCLCIKSWTYRLSQINWQETRCKSQSFPVSCPRNIETIFHEASNTTNLWSTKVWKNTYFLPVKERLSLVYYFFIFLLQPQNKRIINCLLTKPKKKKKRIQQNWEGIEVPTHKWSVQSTGKCNKYEITKHHWVTTKSTPHHIIFGFMWFSLFTFLIYFFFSSSFFQSIEFFVQFPKIKQKQNANDKQLKMYKRKSIVKTLKKLISIKNEKWPSVMVDSEQERQEATTNFVAICFLWY